MYSYGPPHIAGQKAGQPARTYIQLLCEDTGYSPEDLPEAMNDREKWRERVRDICACGTTWWWWEMIKSLYIWFRRKLTFYEKLSSLFLFMLYLETLLLRFYNVTTSLIILTCRNDKYDLNFCNVLATFYHQWTWCLVVWLTARDQSWKILQWGWETVTWEFGVFEDGQLVSNQQRTSNILNFRTVSPPPLGVGYNRWSFNLRIPLHISLFLQMVHSEVAT